MLQNDCLRCASAEVSTQSAIDTVLRNITERCHFALIESVPGAASLCGETIFGKRLFLLVKQTVRALILV
ncbi:unnamed protein product [Soboliphyme baturini]|uniref:Saposin B-type domain-containing protein n=1 Tax=Soboliphyme baturini TaxID=241478 RepID=A0A183J1X6_9BILA|nr:unnamed protein product [Soboliphyme baturini]